MREGPKKSKVPPIVQPVEEDDKDSGMRPTTDSQGFDHWLERKLHKMFDSVASEPIPEDIMDLINRLDEKERNDIQKKS